MTVTLPIKLSFLSAKQDGSETPPAFACMCVCRSVRISMKKTFKVSQNLGKRFDVVLEPINYTLG